VRPVWISLADFAALAMDLAIALLLLALWVNSVAPPQDLPWKPLRLGDPIGLATGLKLDRLAVDPPACLAFLTSSGVSFNRAASPRRNGPCATPTPVRLNQNLLSPPRPLMACALAASFLVWEQNAANRDALALFGRPIRTVDQSGTYACRGVRNGTTAPLSADPSEHATARAIDISGFELSDGGAIEVGGDWRDAGPKGRFLHMIDRQACGPFHTVLSPDFNAAHASHLHLDVGPLNFCR
jgi:hypothetical protein